MSGSPRPSRWRRYHGESLAAVITWDGPMDWNELLRLPTTLLWILSALALLLALVQLVVVRQRLNARRHVAASGHA
ncbi:MAG: hypothetical protein EPN68_08015, partial [Rhodanobacter sp.]